MNISPYAYCHFIECCKGEIALMNWSNMGAPSRVGADLPKFEKV